jgi:PKD repeat protein
VISVTRYGSVRIYDRGEGVALLTLRPTLLIPILGFLSAAAPVAAQHVCDDPPSLTVLTGEQVTASGFASEGHPSAYSWFVTPPGGPTPAKPTSREVSIIVVPDVPGLWSIDLAAEYRHEAPGGGLWSSETCLTLRATSVVASIAPNGAQVPTDESLEIDGHGSRWAAGVIPTVEWQVDGQALGSCNGGPPPATPTDLDCTIPPNWLAPGWHTAGLLLTDPASGETSLSTADFEVIEIIPLSVDFDWSPAEPDPNSVTLFTAAVTPYTAEADFTRVVWDMGDGFIETYTSCPPPYFSTCLQYPYVYADDGWYDVSVTVETADETASQTYRIRVGDPVDPPTAGFNMNPASPMIMSTTTFTFDGECNGTCQWAWDFGDGGTSTLEDPTHTWIVPATLNVTLSVSNEGGNDAVTTPVDVGSCWLPSEPVQIGSCFGGPVTLTAPDGAAWLWNTGATTQSIFATSAGAHWVNIDDGSGCWGNAPKDVSLDNCGDPDGDTDLNGVTDAADLSALAAELTDGDGDAVVNAGGGDLTAPGGDVTGDWNLRADDLLTALIELFGI